MIHIKFLTSKLVQVVEKKKTATKISAPSKHTTINNMLPKESQPKAEDYSLTTSFLITKKKNNMIDKLPHTPSNMSVVKIITKT